MLALGCGSDAAGSDTTSADTPPTTVPNAPPPAAVLDAELVYFDRDGKDERITDPPAGQIADAAALKEFGRRYVDGEPALPAAAANALADGKVLIGGGVSCGCFSADSAKLVLFDGDVQLIPVGLPEPDPELACVRAITSVALVAIDRGDLPEGATVQGN